jgi:hypothetical protein
VEGQGLCEEVIADTPHLDCVACKVPASVGESTSEERDRVVSLSHDKHSYQSFVSIDDEITTEFSHVFLSANHVLFTQPIKMTISTSHHHWYLSEAQRQLLLWLRVNFACDCRVQRSRICQRPQSALTGEDLVRVRPH